jgi:predicted DNA-binding helix-hairpin-helix protein
MKATEHFKKAIQTYLEQRAASDTLFAVSYAKTNKNIDDCITYILNTVQKSGCNGFTDDEIYSMAVHYYDEDNIEVGKPISSRVVVNHTVELTAEEKEEARKQSIQQIHNQTYVQMKQPKKKITSNQPEENNQLSFF